MLPEESDATLLGSFSWALVAGMSSPEKPGVPVPATVLMSPLAVEGVFDGPLGRGRYLLDRRRLQLHQ